MKTIFGALLASLAKLMKHKKWTRKNTFKLHIFFNQRSLIKRLTKSAKCKLVLVSCIQQNSHANKRVAWVLQLDLVKFTFLELWSNSAAKMDNKRHWSKRTLYEKKIQWYIFFLCPVLAILFGLMRMRELSVQYGKQDIGYNSVSKWDKIMLEIDN